PHLILTQRGQVCGQTDRWVVAESAVDRVPIVTAEGKVTGHRHQHTAGRLVCSPCRLVDRKGSQEIPLGADGPVTRVYDNEPPMLGRRWDQGGGTCGAAVDAAPPELAETVERRLRGVGFTVAPPGGAV